MYYDEPYFNLFGFLDDIEIEYTFAYFLNPCQSAGIKLIAPYEFCVRIFDLNRDGMVNGKEKIILRNLFKKGMDLILSELSMPSQGQPKFGRGCTINN